MKTFLITMQLSCFIIIIILITNLFMAGYHEVYLKDAPCGATGFWGLPDNPPKYCGGPLFKGYYKPEWNQPR